MRSNTGMLRKVLVKAIVVGCLVGASAALADGSDSTRPDGGYAEPITCQFSVLADEPACPIEFTSF